MANIASDESPVSKLQLYISCENLTNLDTLSKSDPQVIVFLRNKKGDNYAEVGRTEQLNDNLNPKFSKHIVIDYRFEINQELKFVVLDVDDPKLDWQSQDLIGSLETPLGKIVGGAGGSFTGELLSPKQKKAGRIIITAEEAGELRETYTFRFAARHVDKKDLFGKSDPYLVISKQASGASKWLKVYQSEVVMKTLDPTWKSFTLSAASICGGDKNRKLRFEVYDWDKNSAPDFIGACESTMEQLLDGREIDLINPKKQSKRSYKNSGALICSKVGVEVEHSFVDFLRGGTQLNLLVSVDFTASNGAPAKPTSLHYFTPYQQNQYQMAIGHVGTILSSYDADNKFPVYGFGAKFPNGTVSHCFPLNGNDGNPEVVGVQGMLDVYAHALTNVQLYGPTNFAPTLQNAAKIAEAIPPGHGYLVVMILTDGVITDMDATVKEIVHASQLPMSIIIIGVGNAEFDAMDTLDADDKKLRSSDGTIAERDIVQFVPFNEFLQKGPEALAAEVLKELPGQITGYFKAKHIAPNPPPPSYRG